MQDSVLEVFTMVCIWGKSNLYFSGKNVTEGFIDFEEISEDDQDRLKHVGILTNCALNKFNVRPSVVLFYEMFINASLRLTLTVI